MFVSGGDDYKIKLWNYKQRRCLFTLLGHLDYIRTVQFHHEHPWILSASDDQTIRIWNWQSRICIAVLTGHNHYVMCANFHLKEDLVVSASLDQTVRVWDISGLRKKNVAPGTMRHNNDESLRLQNDLFGNTDAIVKYVLEGHDRGVNWAAFHPTSPLIVSGADDRQIKLWRMNDTKAWEVDTFRGHFNNVSCALFHPRADIILSNSEDKTIRIWDVAKRSGIATFRREHDRFWILAAHPEINLFAAGHDTGLIVFKLERERPAYVSHRNQALYYVKDRYLRFYDIETSRDLPVLSVRRSTNQSVRSIAYNAQDRAILLCSDADGGHYELYQIPRDKRGAAGSSSAQPSDADAVDSKRGLGLSATFVGRKRFAVLKGNEIIVKNLKNEEVKRCTPPVATDRLFQGPTGTLLLRSDDRITLYDIQQRRAIAELQTPPIKFVVWSNDKSPLVALVSKDTIVIATRKLEQLCSVHETMRIKSGVWDDAGVFIYTTLNHVKFLLPNGDGGIVRTLEVPVYLTAVRGNRLYALDRDAKNRIISVDNTEYVFKDALVRRKYDVVLRMVRESNLIGQSIIAYLQSKGFPEVALHFVRDEQTRFNLALECGNIVSALESAKKLDDTDSWHRLGAAALRQGNHQVVEMAYQRTKNFEKLSFLYLITGNVAKLRKMLKIAEMRKDVMGRFHNALYLGDAGERVALLDQVGQTALAYAAASAHGLDEQAAALGEKLRAAKAAEAAAAGGALDGEAGAEGGGDAGGGAAVELPPLPKPDGDLLRPSVPVLRLPDDNWPLLTVSKGYFKGGGLDETSKFSRVLDGEGDADLAAAESAWGGELQLGDDELGDEDAGGAGGGGGDSVLDDGDGGAEGGWGIGAIDEPGADAGGAAAGGDNNGWGADNDLEGLDDLDDLDAPSANASTKSQAEAYWVAPSAGPSYEQQWTRNSSLAAEHAAAGAFDTVAQLLHAQVGAVNLEPLRALYLRQFVGAHAALPGLSLMPSLVSPSMRAEDAQTVAAKKSGRWGAPKLSLSLATLIERLKAAYKATTNGAFGEALQLFQSILHSALLLVVSDHTELAEARELIGLAREYVLGLQLELARKKEESPNRQCELAAYFTHCQLQSIHLLLALRSAMTLCYKLKNYRDAASFARRLLELNPKPEVATQARKVAKFADTNDTNAVELRYDQRNPFVVCGLSHTPIYKGSDNVKCGHCGAAYLTEHKGKLCVVCDVAQIGAESVGLQLIFNQRGGK